MKYIAKLADAVEVSEHNISIFVEYHLPAKSVCVGISKINGRYPQSGTDVDTTIEQIWYVAAGSGTIEIDGQAYQVAKGDMVFIPKNTPYVIDGTLELVVSSSPPWTAEQHKHRDLTG